MKTKITITILVFICLNSFGQMNSYRYRRELLKIDAQWHKIVLPADLFDKVSFDLSDIRIYGVTKTKDTIEVPYIMRWNDHQSVKKMVDFELINQSKNENGYFFTFETQATQPIDEITLCLKQRNFDWQVTVSGSQNMQEWFTLTEGKRICSIKNDQVNFKFTKVSFPRSKFRYYRLNINSREHPDLLSAQITATDKTVGELRKHTIKSFHSIENKKLKQTIVDLDLSRNTPVCNFRISVKEKIDFYRPISIQYVSDSFKTELGWKYNYRELTAGILHSMDNHEFQFSTALFRKARIIIENQDNTPLTIDSIAIQSPVYELIGRFTQPATYFLVYGNEKAPNPQYEIRNFADNIPENLTTSPLGRELLISSNTPHSDESLFKNKLWLWAIMIVIMVILGWFSIKMIKNK